MIRGLRHRIVARHSAAGARGNSSSEQCTAPDFCQYTYYFSSPSTGLIFRLSGCYLERNHQHQHQFVVHFCCYFSAILFVDPPPPKKMFARSAFRVCQSAAPMKNVRLFGPPLPLKTMFPILFQMVTSHCFITVQEHHLANLYARLLYSKPAATPPNPLPPAAATPSFTYSAAPVL